LLLPITAFSYCLLPICLSNKCTWFAVCTVRPMPAAPRPIAQKRGLRFRRRLSRQPFVLFDALLRAPDRTPYSTHRIHYNTYLKKCNPNRKIC